MQQKSDSSRDVCRNFCLYYKPGKKEELSCRGLAVVQKILRSGKNISLKKPASMKPIDPLIQSLLEEHLCAVCPFYEDGCDFVLTKGKAASCGGFMLLAHLLSCGEIATSEIGLESK